MKKKLLLPLLLLFIIFANAQSVYEFETENSTYTNLTGSTSLNNGAVWDDPGYTIPLGFNFTISTHTFSTIYIVDWSFGGELSNNPIDSGILTLISPIGQDIADLGFNSGISQSNISYKTEGSPGNKILKIEWNNIGFLDDSTESDFMNLQLWLYESSNIIEYRYGPNQINNPAESFEGISGPLVTLATSLNIDEGELVDNGYVVEGDPANPTAAIVASGDFYEGDYLEGAIPDGMVYRFTPQTLSTEDFSKIDFKIYPNPASEYLNIKTQTGDYNFNIYNSLGQRMNVTSIENKIYISSLSNGIYFIKIETETGSATKKFIKQ
jgi:hypothetical protein